jgi:hypothetical protein
VRWGSNQIRNENLKAAKLLGQHHQKFGQSYVKKKKDQRQSDAMGKAINPTAT